MAKILYLADVNSAHTQKWVEGVLKHNFQVSIFSLSAVESLWMNELKEVKICSINQRKEVANASQFAKLRYLKSIKALKKFILQEKPDIIHAHYASSYGLMGAISGFHPYFLSVWGSDVYDFPKKSFVHRKIFKWNLCQADCILSTSNSMAKEIGIYTNKKIEVTPFGVDIEMYKPNFQNCDYFTIGTVKSLEKKYGIDDLIETFSLLLREQFEKPLRLLIVGDGTERKKLEDIVLEKKISDKVIFTGKVKQDEVASFHQQLDVFVALSVDDSESFGVSTVEAMSCSVPVVVSDVSGFKEVVIDNETGFVVPKKNPQLACKTIKKLLLNNDLRKQIGENARRHVINEYDWKKNLSNAVVLYKQFISGLVIES
jgi:glycosyltransferase involved in cell wall biosynthesis